MDRSFWATRSGRWRLKLAKNQNENLAQFLSDVIASEIDQRQLPAGALLPPASRVSQELDIPVHIIDDAYADLLVRQLVVQDSSGSLLISDRYGEDIEFGSVTQVALEKQLVEAAKTATQLGLDTLEATGIFKNKLGKESK